MEIANLYGRLVTQNQIDSSLIIQLNLAGERAVLEKGRYAICQRCHYQNLKYQVKLPHHQGYYCQNCIQLGRLTSKDFLYAVPEPNKFKVPEKILTWQGKLSQFQKRCAQELCTKVSQKQNHLIWAVTGAGKTEMLFPMLAENLAKKKRIALATPRIDVCNELYPRLQAAFENISIALLHGQSSMKYFYAQLTICTTHQLLKFKDAFDILIVDEIDSFPFAGNRSLNFATKRACKTSGVMICLTATPDQSTQKSIRQHELTVGYLPLRFHQHPLPEIKFRIERHLSELLEKQQVFPFIKKTVQKWVKQQTPFLIFVPRLSLLKPVFEIVKQIVDNKKVQGETVHAADEHRIAKVQALRDGRLRYLVTTTILERGVTFKNLDLMVIKAEDRNFSCSSLVQIAGRVGRNAQRPTGDVYFVMQHYTKNVKQAAQQIRHLNQKAQHLLDE